MQENYVITDNQRILRVYRVQPLRHAEGMLMAHLPAESAQVVIEALGAAGIKAILNFAPGRIKSGKDARLKNVDLSIELETLSFYLAQGAR